MWYGSKPVTNISNGVKWYEAGMLLTLRGKSGGNGTLGEQVNKQVRYFRTGLEHSSSGLCGQLFFRMCGPALDVVQV